VARKRRKTRRKRSAWATAKAQMAPSRVLVRFISGGKYNSPRALRRAVARSVVKKGSTREVSRQTPEAYERLMGQQARAAKKTAAKAKRPSVYEQARQIPGQNRTAAARVAQAQARQSRGGGRQYVQGRDGRMAGSRPMSEQDRALYERAVQRAEAPAPTPRRRA
jgi:hypothetical protein